MNHIWEVEVSVPDALAPKRGNHGGKKVARLASPTQPNMHLCKSACAKGCAASLSVSTGFVTLGARSPTLSWLNRPSSSLTDSVGRPETLTDQESCDPSRLRLRRDTSRPSRSDSCTNTGANRNKSVSERAAVAAIAGRAPVQTPTTTRSTCSFHSSGSRSLCLE